MCIEGDTNNLLTMEARAKCIRWKEFKFLGKFDSQFGNFAKFVEFINPKFKDEEAKSDMLVEIVIDMKQFFGMLRTANIPIEEITLLEGYL